MLVDQAQILVKAGDGGDGVVHFHREKYVPRGGPDGGDGGYGGHVFLEATRHFNTLISFHYKERFFAPAGAKGAKNNMSGKKGRELVIKVPAGTMIYDADTGELLGDLVIDGQRLMVAKGGRGGRGNQHFAAPNNQVPQMAEHGEPGVERRLRLELKLIADVGIVGMPNAGKSSLLAAVTNADPKIANYPFTTLEPNLGVAELDLNHNLVMADIPGLIEGAHRGVGLGDTFLRHIQRCKVLIHLLDGLSEDPLADFSQINTELSLFDEKLAQKPQVVVLNKMDLPEVQERWPQIKTELEKRGYHPMAISAMARTDVNPVLWKVVEMLTKAPEAAEPEAVPVYRPSEDPRAFTIEQVQGGYRLHSEALERAASMTYWEFDAPRKRFQRLMETIGVDKALREAGVVEGNMIYIGEYELEWQD